VTGGIQRTSSSASTATAASSRAYPGRGITCLPQNRPTITPVLAEAS
jgi:hypothetical protein